MSCPACHEQMRNMTVDNQEVLHCANCGASFFEDNGINRIGIEKARTLAKERYNRGSAVIQNPRCPRDESALVQLTGKEAIPKTVRLFQCPQCRGIFATADDLEMFKHAQLSKLDYFRTWNLPLGSLKGVLAIALLLVLGGTMYWSFNTIYQEATIRSEATEVIKNVDVSHSADYMLISFTTKTPLRSYLITDNKTTRSVIMEPISAEPQTAHTISVPRSGNSELIQYRIRLDDRNGRTIETQEIDVK